MNLEMGQRGTSNLVGFVLLFGVISMLCGLLMATYASDLHNDREELRLSLAGRQLCTFQGGIANVAHSNSPAPVNVEFGIETGHCLTAWNPSFTSFYLCLGNDSATIYCETLGTVEYRAPFAGVTLEGGAVVRWGLRGESTVLSPPWFIANGTLVMEVYRLDGDDLPATRGGLVVLEGRHLSTQRQHFDLDPLERLTVYLRTSCPGAWADFLSGLGMSATAGTGEVSAFALGIQALELIEHRFEIRRVE